MAAIALKYSAADSDWRLAATRNPFHLFVGNCPIIANHVRSVEPSAADMLRVCTVLPSAGLAKGEISPSGAASAQLTVSDGGGLDIEATSDAWMHAVLAFQVSNTFACCSSLAGCAGYAMVCDAIVIKGEG